MNSPVPLSFILLDLFIYLQHVLFHAVPGLWRLHRMHHADLEFDVTTGVRFHPIEVLLSMVIKFGAVAALGAPAIAVLIFDRHRAIPRSKRAAFSPHAAPAFS
jgi:sterol desaturase/sphingolipid hydroxylase (fatty acid hydroxylase superfamily)